MPMNAICQWCRKPYKPSNKGQKFCCRQCAVKGRKQDPTPITDRPKQIVSILITKQIPVYEHLRPKVGHIYSAVAAVPPSSQKFYLIPDIGDKGLIVRSDECVEVQEGVDRLEECMV